MEMFKIEKSPIMGEISWLTREPVSFMLSPLNDIRLIFEHPASWPRVTLGSSAICPRVQTKKWPLSLLLVVSARWDN